VTVDRGHGPPIFMIPGIQGRWEWMAPAIEALGVRHRVLSGSLRQLGETPVADRTFETWFAGIDALLDRAGLRQAAVAGVSFGGLIAAGYAAARPDRVSALVLIGTPAPRWRDDHPSASYVKHPRLSVPQFVAGALGRLLPEVRSSISGWSARVVFLARHLGRVLRYPASPTRMAACVRAWQATDIVSACRRVTAPTLIVTGEPELDRVVPVSASLEYLSLIRGARHQTLARTGHIGLVTRPREFAALISGFLAAEQAAVTNKAG